MIIKHVEFKVICDGCMSDITDWKAVPKDALRRYAKKEGIKLGYMDACLCEDCQKAMNEASENAIETNKSTPMPTQITTHHINRNSPHSHGGKFTLLQQKPQHLATFKQNIATY